MSQKTTTTPARHRRTAMTAAAGWARVRTGAYDGYAKGDLLVVDNGAGVGSARGSGRWAVEVAGRWIANVDTLVEAKRLAEERAA